MRRFHLGRRDNDPGERPQPEDQAVRQYRYLLRTAPADALVAAHAEALPRLSAEARADLLRTVQETVMAGQRLRPDDHAAIGHLMTLGERRTPGALLSAYPADTLESLAKQLIATDAVFGLFASYAGWDGADPEPEDDSAWAAAGFSPDRRWDERSGSGDGGSPKNPGTGDAASAMGGG